MVAPPVCVANSILFFARSVSCLLSRFRFRGTRSWNGLRLTLAMIDGPRPLQAWANRQIV
jgi:hypothetical protein